MMHLLTIFLSFSFYLICFGDKQFELDSKEVSGDSTWNGLVVLVNSDETDKPEVVLSSSIDTYSLVYCLTLERLFEAKLYETNVSSEDYGKYDEESNTKIDFENDVTWTYSKSADGTSFTLNGILTDPTNTNDHSYFDSMTFEFVVSTAEDDTSSWGLEYSFALNGYIWTSSDPNAKLVLVFEFKSCDSDFDEQDFENDDTNNNDIETTAVSVSRRRRRLLSDQTTNEPQDDGSDGDDDVSDDGISSEDSQELDLGVARFINHGQAFCANTTDEIGTHIIFGDMLGSDELHVVFDHFDCDLFADPWVGLMSGKYSDSALRSFSLCFIWIIGGLFMFLL